MIVENKTNPDDCLWLPSLRKEESDWQNLLSSLGILYQQGLKIDWYGFNQDYPYLERVSLPNYPWQHQRYWHGDSVSNSVDDSQQWLYEVVWEKDSSISVVNLASNVMEEKTTTVITSNELVIEGVSVKNHPLTKVSTENNPHGISIHIESEEDSSYKSP